MWKRTRLVAVLGVGLALCLGVLMGPASAAENAPRIGAAEVRILAALDDSTTIDFIDEPLSGCVDFIKDCHEFEIQFDERALEDVGVGTDEPISRRLEGISLRSALNLILRDIGLDWTIANEVLLITSPEEAEMNLVARVYDLGDLAKVRAPDGKSYHDLDSVIELLTSTIQPCDWEEVGGPGSICPFELRGAVGLVIRHTPRVHQKVSRILIDLDELADKHGDDVYPTREQAIGFRVGGMGGTSGVMGGGMGGMGMGGGFLPTPPAKKPTEKPAEQE